MKLRDATINFAANFRRNTIFVSALCVVALAGCSGGGSEMFGSNNADQWFSKPFASFSKSTVAVADTTTVRPATPEDFVDGSGRCAFASAPSQPQINADGSETIQSAPSGPTVAGGIALLMTECEVVARAGAPERVDIGASANGDRTTVLTYMHGPWPGIYRFNAGRLAEIERVVEPEPPKPAPRKKPAPKKRAAVQ
jgi:hypothetical protein